MNTVGKRIREARINAGLKQPELANKIGWGQSRLSNYERGEREPGLDDLKAISKALNIDITQLISDNSIISNILKYEVREPSAELLGAIEPWDRNTPLNNDEVFVPFYMEVELAAGLGSAVQLESTGPKLRFAKSTLRKAGVEAGHAACVKINGSSMEPVLPDGSTVGIDTLSKTIKDGKMYAINHDGMLRVKVLYRLPGSGIRLKSFNSDEYPDEIYPQDQAEDIKIIGRVFWSSAMW